MASVYNSTPFIPSQGTSSYALQQDNFYQFDNKKWEDTKIYTSVILTVSCETPGNVKLRWTNSRETSNGIETIPNSTDLDDPLARDEFYYQPGHGQLTKQYDTRARWLNVWYDGSLSDAVDASLTLSTLYKKAPTEIKFANDSQDIVKVNAGANNGNSLYTAVTDMSGLLINTTMEGQEGEALYVHLADTSGTSLDTTYLPDDSGNLTLSTALRDNNNYNLSSTGIDGCYNALAVHPSNVNGYSQGGTMSINEAAFGDVALHYALSDSSGVIVDTTKTGYGYSTDAVGNNALYVHLNNRQTEHVRRGESIDTESPLDVQFQGEYYDGQMFDLTVSGPLTTFGDISNGGINLHSLSLSNESPTTIWIKLYDVSSGVVDSTDINTYAMDLSHNVAFNIAVPHLGTRDIVFNRPVSIQNGLHFASSTHHRKELTMHPPGKESLFISGSYKPISISLTEFLRRNQDADPDDYFEE